MIENSKVTMGKYRVCSPFKHFLGNVAEHFADNPHVSIDANGDVFVIA